MLYQHSDDFLYLDLQNLNDLNKLREPMLFFQANQDKVLCLDEIQLTPELFSVLRSEIDRYRRPGRFILLGSASHDPIQKTSESLAGRVGLIELTPFTVQEVEQHSIFDMNKLWLRRGYPDSYLASSDHGSVILRENFLRTYVERDIPQLGFQIPALQLRRLLTMCAHNQGQLFNSSKLGESLGATYQTIRRYIDLIIEKGTQTIAVECTASSAPKVTKGFWSAIDTIKPDKTYIVSPVATAYHYKNDVEVCGLSDFLSKVGF
jgi:predicted AAA+ superfamily ATPase